MVYFMTMKVINIYEAKAKLSEYLDAVAGGERVLICKRNQPVAELRAIPGARTSPRPIGKAAGRLQVPAAFFEPLPDEIADGFAGLEEPPRPVRRPARVAETPGDYRVGSRSRRSK
jgi:antitoxin (DNA-binding transcriptional repressor) of toxin-antitoxin stability system